MKEFKQTLDWLVKQVDKINDAGCGCEDCAEITHTSQIINNGASGESTYVENNELGSVAYTNNFNDLDDKPLSLFLGLYTSLDALETAHPSGIAGNYANVDTGVGEDALRYIWDTNDFKWVLSSGVHYTNTSELINDGSDGTSTYVEHEKVTEIIHNNINTLIDNNALVPGTNYLITDYRTIKPIVGTSEYHIAEIEQIIVKALTPNTIDPIAQSYTYPNEIVHYDINRKNTFYNLFFVDVYDGIIIGSDNSASTIEIISDTSFKISGVAVTPRTEWIEFEISVRKQSYPHVNIIYRYTIEDGEFMDGCTGITYDEVTQIFTFEGTTEMFLTEWENHHRIEFSEEHDTGYPKGLIVRRDVPHQHIKVGTDYRGTLVRRYKAVAPNWEEGTYLAGENVRYNDYIWKCIEETNMAPDEWSGFWLPILDDTKYLLSGNMILGGGAYIQGETSVDYEDLPFFSASTIAGITSGEVLNLEIFNLEDDFYPEDDINLHLDNGSNLKLYLFNGYHSEAGVNNFVTLVNVHNCEFKRISTAILTNVSDSRVSYMQDTHLNNFFNNRIDRVVEVYLSSSSESELFQSNILKSISNSICAGEFSNNLLGEIAEFIFFQGRFVSNTGGNIYNLFTNSDVLGNVISFLYDSVISQPLYDSIVTGIINIDSPTENKIIGYDSEIVDYTVATLPIGTAGMKLHVTDSTVSMAGNYGSVVAGGGSNYVPVFSDGTNWLIG